MLRAILALAVCFVSVGLVAFAEDKKDEKKTYEGKLVCAKCTLKAEGIKSCTNALKVKDGDKEVIYYLKDEGKKESYHGAICGAGTDTDVKVTGKLVEKDGKKWLEDVKVEVKK
jgi:hypothetical protein